jgi:KipI family sensor histidine kinase inhibitor
VNAPHKINVAVEPFGDSAVMVTIPGGDSRRRREDIVEFRDRLLSRLPVGVLEVVSGLESLLVEFDPIDTSPEHIVYAAGLLTELASVGGGSVGDGATRRSPQHFAVPVVFDAEAGPDLASVAEEVGSTIDDLIEAIAGSEFTIALLGAAMAPMMDGLELARGVRRRAEPRTDVPPGSLMVAGDNAIIQPFPGPSGWRVVGRTPCAIVDITRDPPISFATGDRVRFVPIRRDEAAGYDGAFLLPDGRRS